MTIKSKRVGFLGAGNMGEAMIKGLTQAGLVPAASIGATDARADRLDQMARQYGIRAFASNPALVAESDVVILAVKPQIMARCCARSRPPSTGRSSSSRSPRASRPARCASISPSPRA